MPTKIITVVISLLFIALSTSAIAAPQILGLVATSQPLPLTCKNGTCKVEVTTVCLQEHRVAPMPGRAYTAGKGTEITMNIAAANGLRKSISVSKKISIIAQRHYTSVVLSLPENVLNQFGYDKGQARASITVSALASAVPVPKASDKKPLSASEIAEYTGPLRHIAKDVFGRDSVNVETTQRLNQVINRLPDDFTSDQAQFEKGWAEVAKAAARRKIPEVDRAISQIGQTCRYEFKVGKYATMRSCLEQHHDVLASDTNKKVWQAMKPGL